MADRLAHDPRPPRLLPPSQELRSPVGAAAASCKGSQGSAITQGLARVPSGFLVRDPAQGRSRFACRHRVSSGSSVWDAPCPFCFHAVGFGVRPGQLFCGRPPSPVLGLWDVFSRLESAVRPPPLPWDNSSPRRNKSGTPERVPREQVVG